MIVSVNWLKKYTDIDVSIDELTRLIGSRLVEIEEVVDLGKKYEGVVIAKVIKCEPLEGSDHLSVCMVDDAGVVKGVERDAEGLVQVVCGAPNVREGLTVAWLPPNSVVPETYEDAEPFVLGARKLRGAMSNGMLASAKELDLFDDHTGIVELGSNRSAGEKFAEAYELNDYLLDIENKSLTHRPDTFGLIGFAREVAGIQGKKFETPKSLSNRDIDWGEKVGEESAPAVTIEDDNLCSRYQAVVLTDIDGGVRSPLETQTYLARIGVRPHRAAVDVTNYLMMLTGQPLHVFDYDKLKAVNDGVIDIRVRAGRAGEKLTLIDDREIELSTDDIVIANGDVPVALAGAMGGRDTEVDENTTSVLLESASFNLYNLRNTQFRHGIFSEAITRFTKGQSPELTAPVLAEAIKILGLSVGAKRVSDIADEYPKPQKQPKVYAMAEHMNAALGTNYTTEQIVQTLENVEFEVSVNKGGVIAVVPPYWRVDIHVSEDIDEEIGRLNGFDSIIPTLPRREFNAVSPDNFDKVRAKIRQALVRAGANEVLTYSFVHGDLLKKAGQDPENSYRIVNSISPDLQYYRQSILPSLLSLVHPNIKAGFDEFALFELNKAHAKSDGLDEDGLPIERDFLAFVVARKKSQNGAAYFEAKQHLEFLGKQLGLDIVFEPAFDNPKSANAKPFDIQRSAAVKVGDTVLGIVGEFKSAVHKSFKLPEHTAGFVVSSTELARLAGQEGLLYRPLSRYPAIERDICFKVERSVSYASIVAAAEGALDAIGHEVTLSPLDIYRPEDGLSRNVTLRVRIVSHERTLTGDDAQQVLDVLSHGVIAATGASIV